MSREMCGSLTFAKKTKGTERTKEARKRLVRSKVRTPAAKASNPHLGFLILFVPDTCSVLFVVAECVGCQTFHYYFQPGPLILVHTYAKVSPPYTLMGNVRPTQVV